MGIVNDLRRGEFMGAPHGYFPVDAGGVGGVIVKREDLTPSATGTVIYLNTGKDMDGVISRTVSAGGQVLMPVTSIGQQGHIAIILDTEGNRVGLHQPAKEER